MNDAEFINHISELLFGYREASSEEIQDRLQSLIEHERDVKLSNAAKQKAETLNRIARELAELAY